MITLLNAAPDTGNQGVSALCHSVVAGLARRGLGDLTVADHGRGRRLADWGHATVALVGLSHTRRFWRGDCLRTAHMLVRAGGGGSAAARAVLRSRAVLDISGGDSFTDIYGRKRFRAMALTKRMALDAGVPLILLPQKIGPFRDPALKAEAVAILARARAVWVRDAESHAFLVSCLGTAFDPDRHRLGVDVAVGLPQRRPETLDRDLCAWLSRDRTFPLAGLNVSGLLCNRPDAARGSFGLAARHDEQLTETARALLRADRSLRLLLVPHVHRPECDPESDLSAARALLRRLGPLAEGRVRVLDGRHDAMALKWILGRLDWFAGARMHATIGAFSSGVPTLGLGYTDKARGVFSECGIGTEVADLRQLGAAALAARAVHAFRDRDRIRECLSRSVPRIRARAEREIDEIVRQIGA